MITTANIYAYGAARKKKRLRKQERLILKYDKKTILHSLSFFILGKLRIQKGFSNSFRHPKFIV